MNERKISEKRDYTEEIIQMLKNRDSFVYNPKKSAKIPDNLFQIPEPSDIDNILEKNYRVTQLKKICSHYKLPKSGNKNQIMTRIYYHLYLYRIVKKIQSAFRNRIVRRLNKLRGPGLIHRNLCINETDFYSLETMREIPYNQFISITLDDENTPKQYVYGFNIISLYNLFLKYKDKTKNPYTMTSFPRNAIKKIRRFLKLSKLLNIKINTDLENDTSDLSSTAQLELKALEIFQHINYLGNYSDSVWFLELSRTNMMRFVRELMDIWNYRVDLTWDMRRNICPPNGNPFREYMNTPRVIEMMRTSPLLTVKKKVLKIIETFVRSAHEEQYQSLGALYVLGALTIVCDEARESLPWLYQSFSL